ncbi:hypothetical protein CCR75_003374 [Bremia lactucae]|uniref:Uncharacterized protein n=1 Tax=Bremia lactucae TaxID=4779 RepID=A0A976FH36_BRELC|nr:hypothetical protein CCR75_003374 [Bremia lactucae]
MPQFARSLGSSPSTYELTLKYQGEHCQYLGVLIGSDNTERVILDAWVQSIWTRLALAREKRHNVEQRAELDGAIRSRRYYSWRSTEIKQATVSRLHKSGLSVHCVKSEIIAMAAAPIGRWVTMPV